MKKKLMMIFALVLIGGLLSGCGCKHAHTTRVDVLEATCTEKGYTGDLYCEDCRKVIEKGTETAEKGHVPAGKRDGEVKATCKQDGYTGDVVCSVCGEVMEKGEAVPALPHTPAEKREGELEATCAYTGYTGDVVCRICGQVIEKGEEIPMLPHTPQDERIGAKEAKCYRDGFTGTLYCDVCNQVIDMGQIIPQTPHAWEERDKKEVSCLWDGYTGDRVCTQCLTEERGEVIPRLAHDYDEKNTCRRCGYRVPGIYVEDRLELTWKELLDSGLVSVKDGELTKVANTLYGTLVIAEDVNDIAAGCARECGLEGVWFPGRVYEIGDGAFRNSEKLKDIRFFGQVDKMGESCFGYCPSLTSFAFPEGMTGYYKLPFKGSEAISRIEFSQSMLEGATELNLPLPALSEVNAWPQHLVSLQMYNNKFEVLCGLPETLESIGVKKSTALRLADFSGTKLKELSFVEDTSGANMYAKRFGGIRLEYLALPETLTGLCIHGEAPMRCLILPDSVTYLEITNGEGMLTLLADGASAVETAIEVMVWPVSLKSEGVAWNLPATTGLKTVYYRGSEAVWKMSGMADLMPADVKMVFNCTDEMVQQLKEEAFSALSPADQALLRGE